MSTTSHTTANEDYVRGYQTMSRKRIVEIAANRVVVERVKGLLMFVYEIDADHASSCCDGGRGAPTSRCVSSPIGS